MISKLTYTLLGLISLLIFSHDCLSQGQAAASNFGYENLAKVGTSSLMIHYDTRYEGTKGNPYFFDDFKDSELILNDSSSYHVPLNIDLLLNSILVQSNRGDLIVDFRKAGQINADNRHFLILPVDGDPDLGFFESLYTSPGGYLLKGYTKIILKADYKGAYSSGEQADRIIDRSAYYLYRNNELEEINPSSKKKLAEALDTDAGNLKKYIKEENLNPKEENDLITLIKHQFDQ